MSCYANRFLPTRSIDPSRDTPHQPLQSSSLVLNLSSQPSRKQWHRRPQPGEAYRVLFGGEECISAGGRGLGCEPLQIGGGVAIVIAKNPPPCEPYPGGFQTRKELLRPCDPAKRQHRTSDLRHIHAAPQAPDRPDPSRLLGIAIDWHRLQQISRKLFVLSRNRQHSCSLQRGKRLPQISRGEKPISKIGAAEEQDVDIAMKLPVLKAVVEKMERGDSRRRLRLGKQTGVVAPRSHIHGHSGLPRDEQRLVPELGRRSIGTYARGLPSTPPVSARKHIHVEPVCRESPGKSDGQRCLAGSSSGQVSHADYRKPQPLQRLGARSQTPLAQCQSHPVKRDQRSQ